MTAKTVIVCCISCIILITLPVFMIARVYKNEIVHFLYNEKEHTLLILNSESAKYIQKIILDLHQDTLSLNVYKKLVLFKSTNIIDYAYWKIKLKPNVKFIKLRDKVTPLYKIKKYPEKDLLDTYYPAIEIYPQKFPYVCK